MTKLRPVGWLESSKLDHNKPEIWHYSERIPSFMHATFSCHANLLPVCCSQDENGNTAVTRSLIPVIALPLGRRKKSNSPRRRKALLCHPTYGPWQWHVFQGASPGACGRGPKCWCQESRGLQDADLLQRRWSLDLALPWRSRIFTESLC